MANPGKCHSASLPRSCALKIQNLFLIISGLVEPLVWTCFERGPVDELDPKYVWSE